jgi:hypothetical protein
MHVNAKSDDRQRQFEATARAAFELCADRKLTDAEWAAVRGRLVEFAGILRAWDQTSSPSATR